MKKIIRKDVQKTLKAVLVSDENKKHIGDGVLNPIDHIDDEVWIQIMDSVDTDRKLDTTNPGPTQVHIGGTKRGFEQLATVLMTLARINNFSPDYSLQFDWKLLTSSKSLHIVLHKPVDKIKEKRTFLKIHNVGHALFSRGGKKIREKKDGAD